MFDMLTAIYRDELPLQQIFCSLEDPESPEERRIANQLRAVPEDVAEALTTSIAALADKKGEEGFYSGVRFGARLMAELIAP